MPFPKAPALKYQIVLCHLGQRNFKSAAGLGRQNDIIEGSARRDVFDRAAARNAKETREWDRRHPLHPTVLAGRNQVDRHQFSGPYCLIDLGPLRVRSREANDASLKREYRYVTCQPHPDNLRLPRPALKTRIALDLMPAFNMVTLGAVEFHDGWSQVWFL
jgi:hypothetical protein